MSAPRSSAPRTTIIGLGRLGQALARSLPAAGFPIHSLFTRNGSRLSDEFAITGSFPEQKQQLGRLVFLTVPDQAIAEVAQRLAMLDTNFSDHTFIHCSGSEPAERLAELGRLKAAIAAFHPVQTFTAHSGPEDFHNIYFSMQGNPDAFRDLKQIAGQLGARSFEVDNDQKTSLHAAAAMASNYLVTLLSTAAETGAGGGLPESQVKQVLLPLMHTTLRNLQNYPIRDALTGPVRRGDVETVKSHLALLKEQPHLLEVYRVLGRQTVELAEGTGDLREQQLSALRELLDQTV